jgi:hypothetical protein
LIGGLAVVGPFSPSAFIEASCSARKAKAAKGLHIAKEVEMARRFNGLNVAGERTVRRVAKVGKVERWLVVNTSIMDNGPEMGQLITAA